jgi:ABC-type polysaccharide/polyol phosphate transport system ATPase subunit
MERNIVVAARGVSKKFRISDDPPRSLKERILRLRDSSWHDMWALKNINLELKKGAALALIGRNGSGKSTLLKVLSRILYPDEGSISINGRVSGLLELGAGMHPEFTGRENIFINASIFNMSKKEVQARLDDIIRFSELGSFIDNPVRIYSSGMYMRLAFSVAVNIDPDILFIDEILAVGDSAFQAKCIERLHEFRKKGVSLIVVSHGTDVVEQLCDHAILLHQGEIEMADTPGKVIRHYNKMLAKTSL